MLSQRYLEKQCCGNSFRFCFAGQIAWVILPYTIFLQLLIFLQLERSHAKDQIVKGDRLHKGRDFTEDRSYHDPVSFVFSACFRKYEVVECSNLHTEEILICLFEIMVSKTGKNRDLLGNEKSGYLF